MVWVLFGQSAQVDALYNGRLYSYPRLQLISIFSGGWGWPRIMSTSFFFLKKKKHLAFRKTCQCCDVFHGDLGLNPAAVSPFMHSRQYLSNEMQYTFLNSTHLRQVSSIISDFFSKPLLQLRNSYCQGVAFMIFQIYKDVCPPPHTHRITLILSCFYFYVFIPNVCGNNT